MAMDALLEVSEGDLRRSITLLQSTSLLYQGKIDAAQLREVAGVVPPELCKQLLSAITSSPLTEVLRQVEDLEMEGYGAQVLPVMLDLVTAANMEDRKKAACANLLALADARLTDGVNEDLQLRWVCTEMHKTLQVA
jgi:DNA polymerase III delta prime subunit